MRLPAASRACQSRESKLGTATKSVSTRAIYVAKTSPYKQSTFAETPPIAPNNRRA